MNLLIKLAYKVVGLVPWRELARQLVEYGGKLSEEHCAEETVRYLQFETIGLFELLFHFVHEMDHEG